MSDFVVVNWGCIARPEQDALAYTADYPRIVTPAIPELYFNVNFFLYSPTWWERRRDEFLGAWHYTREVIEIEGEEIVVYRPPTDWLYPLSDARVAGHCVVGETCCRGMTFRDTPSYPVRCEPE